MLTVCSATALLCIIGLLTATGTRALLFPLMVLLGGACDGFYTLGLAVMSRSVPRQQLAAGNACFVALCGAGEIAGPLLAGGGTALAGPGGLIGAFAVLLLAYCVVLFRDAGPRLVARHRRMIFLRVIIPLYLVCSSMIFSENRSTSGHARRLRP